jgi:hypothetical protein
MTVKSSARNLPGMIEDNFRFCDSLVKGEAVLLLFANRHLE